MKNYGKIFKLMMLVLIVISVVLLVWGFIVGFESNGGSPVEVLLYWAYVMIAIAALAWIAVGLVIGIKNNGPKYLVKLGIGLAAIAVVCLIAYLLAPGKPAMGMLEQPSEGTLKLTDTILNLTYFAGGAAILSIIAGEIVMAVRNK